MAHGAKIQAFSMPTINQNSPRTLCYIIQKRNGQPISILIMNSGDPMEFNAYYGDYDIEVAFGDTVKVFTIPCLKENKDSVFTFIRKRCQIKRTPIS